VHFVTPELDAGAVIAQVVVPIVDGDTVETLTMRVLAHEHALLVAVLRLAVAGHIAERNASVVFHGHPLFTPLRLDSTGLLRPPT
jgi:phosphoribosylglycinamide formyltransferase-1